MLKKKILEKINNKENGNASLVMMFVFIGAFLFFLVIYTLLTSASLMSQQHEIDDCLTDALLGATLPDDENKFVIRNDEDNLVNGTTVYDFITFDRYDTDESEICDKVYKTFTDIVNKEIKMKDNNFFDELTIEKLICYEVNNSNNTCRVTTFSNNGTSKITKTIDLSEAKTPTGKEVTRTSVYVNVSFKVHAYFILDIDKTVYRDLYTTVREIDDTEYKYDYDISEIGPNR